MYKHIQSITQAVTFMIAIFWLALTTISFAAENELVAAKLKELIDKKQSDVTLALGSNFGQVANFYKTRNFKPIWVRDNGPKSKGKSLLEELKRSKLHGLSPSFYGVEKLETLISSLKPNKLAELDLLLSAAFIEYSSDLKNGRINPSNGYSQNLVKPVTTTADALVKGAAEAGNFRNMAKLFLTTDERYFRLIAKFLELIRIDRAGNWPKIAADGKPISAGQRDERIKAFRVLLALTQDLPPEEMKGENVLDPKLANAIKTYQQRHGIPQTGNIDKTTLASMAEPVKQRLRKILINLERRRWQNRELGPDHVYVNLADSMARLVIAGKTIGFFEVDASSNLPAFFGTITGFQRDKSTPEKARILLKAQAPANEVIAGETLTLNVPETWNPSSTLGETYTTQTKAFGQIDLKQPLNIYVTYLTTWTNKAGTLFVREDVANRDEALIESLELN